MLNANCLEASMKAALSSLSLSTCNITLEKV